MVTERLEYRLVCPADRSSKENNVLDLIGGGVGDGLLGAGDKPSFKSSSWRRWQPAENNSRHASAKGKDGFGLQDAAPPPLFEHVCIRKKAVGLDILIRGRDGRRHSVSIPKEDETPTENKTPKY